VAYSLFLLISVVWGSSFILMERASHAFGPVAIGITRLLGGTAVLLVVWWLQNRPYRVSRRDLFHITFVTFIATAVPFVVLPYVIAQGFGHSYMGMLMAIVPLATILFSIPMLRIWPTGRQLLGVLGGLCCLVYILHAGADRGMSPGLLALAASVPLTYAFGNTYIKWKLDHVPALPLTILLLGIAALMLLPLEFITPWRDYLGMAPPAEPTHWPQAVAAMAFLGVVATGIPVLIFLHLVIKQGPLFAGMVTYVVPLLAMLWGTYDREPITPLQVAAMIGVLAMVALVQYGAVRNLSAGDHDDVVGKPRRAHVGPAAAPSAHDSNGRSNGAPAAAGQPFLRR
jgi:drug/metabolite transporter (DMT)-like permease